MGRGILFIVIAVIAGLITLVKKGVGTVNKNYKDTSFKGESKKVMNKTAKGLNWMDEQWKEAKKKAEDESDRR